MIYESEHILRNSSLTDLERKQIYRFWNISSVLYSHSVKVLRLIVVDSSVNLVKILYLRCYRYGINVIQLSRCSF
jgi:hypothetical protein